MYAMEYSKQERAAPAAIAIVAHLALVYIFAAAIGVVPSPMPPRGLEYVDVPPPVEKIKSQPIQPSTESSSLPRNPQLYVPPEPLIEVDSNKPSSVGSTEPTGEQGHTAIIEEAVTNPRILSSSQPEYPMTSRRNEEEGTVLIKVMVSPYGTASDVQLEKSSGYPRLDAAAIKAARAWTFVPAQRGSQAIARWISVPVTFVLNGRR